MSIERARSWTGSSPEVTKRLCATIVFFFGIICICGGYLLGHISRSELKRNGDIATVNLTSAAETLLRKAKTISPKTIHHNDSEKIQARLLEIFQCNTTDCGTINKFSLPGLVRKCINNEVNKLIRSVFNATVYLDSLR